MQNKVRQNLLISLIFISLISLTGCFSWSLPSKTHSPKNVTGLDELWLLSNVYVGRNNLSPMMVASEGNIIINGGLAYNDGENIIGLDGSNGIELWRQGDYYPATALSVAPDGVYVGYSGRPHVIKNDFSSGDVIWSQRLNGRGLGPIYIVGDEVQVSTAPFIFTVLDSDNGEVKYQLKGNDIYIRTPIETFMPQIQAKETSTGNVLWKRFDLDKMLFLPPIFLNDRILVRTGAEGGSLYALDKVTGETLWKSSDNIISSIAYSPKNEQAYVLTVDGYLLGIDKENGTQIVLAKFSNAPFVLDGKDKGGGYEVAFDDSTQMLYVLLGDSRQLFAFQVE
jgi:outer membrane protein assembly factor BamB